MHELELNETETREAARLLGETIASYHAQLPDLPVFPRVDWEALRTILNEPLPESGRPLESLYREFADVVIANSTHTPHPRFLGYVMASPSDTAPFAEALAAALNQNCSIWTLAPAATAIELTVIRWFLELFGFPAEAGGILTSGGSMANTVALAAARDAHHPGDARRDGLQSLPHPLLAYATHDVHHSVGKAMSTLGLGTKALRTVSHDAGFRMDVENLKRRVREDRAHGGRPFCVVASAGTVATGAFDPIDAIADFCAEEGLWLHVDGAYGAFAILSETMRETLRSCARADSLSLDPHKLLFSSIEAGCVLVRDRTTLSDAFRESASYIGEYESRELVDFRDMGPQLSRNFKALKIWWSIRAFGMGAHRAVIDRVLDLAAYMGRRIEAEPELELAATVTLTSVCFRCIALDDAQNEQLLNTLVDGGSAFITRATLNDTFYMRACFTNFRTSRADVDAILDEILRLYAAFPR